MNAIHLYRIANWFYHKRIPVIPAAMKNIMFLLFNSYIPPSATIGKGTVFAYGAIGVVLHADSKLGSGCVIGQGVTIGASEAFFSGEPNKCPIIGNNVYIGAGARILGNITIGDGCQIGAGAVVIRDVPPHSIVVGVPGRVVGKTPTDYLAIRS
ncbi:serine O-acetyltransferase [Noviherbaspirillum autotrophicum]|uniref:Serine acetyltransferase n=1 Tax=Noviherbaspirillum autotrophicum TaxID=709839 RepID=A0A0C2BSE4_9BURK|nr:serine acetyltransferase [Noviherbaspirillum autotrophicum]KIF82710.1 serine acetyltransferase [Noviherbaspirillum autotrophicum]KIF84160.1 serine acetyltransferase [Noviherbaspirillum autotrophicum]